jgi:predicted Zn-ribbon and HTH transcriptional regulator
MKAQFEILQLIQRDGYNVVTCGNCGYVVLLEIDDIIEEVQCPHCKETMEYCDMPDLYTR